MIAAEEYESSKTTTFLYEDSHTSSSTPQMAAIESPSVETSSVETNSYKETFTVDEIYGNLPPSPPGNISTSSASTVKVKVNLKESVRKVQGAFHNENSELHDFGLDTTAKNQANVILAAQLFMDAGDQAKKKRDCRLM